MIARVCLVATVIAAVLVWGAAAQVSPLDAWLFDVERLPVLERSAAIEARIAQAGGTPLVDGQDVLFVVRAPLEATPSVVGDFNDWGNDGARQNPETGRMRPVPGTPWFALSARLPVNARIEYLVDYGGYRLSIDPLNPRQAAGRDRSYSEISMPAHVVPDEVKAAVTAGDPDAGLERHYLQSRIFDGPRLVVVHRPSVATTAERLFPTVYFADGSSWIRLGLAARVIDGLVANGQIDPVVAVFSDPGDRHGEYSLSENNRRFYSDELVPFVESRYPVDRRREARAVVGSSLGALAALDLVVRRADVFTFAALFSPTTRPHDVEALLRSGGPDPGRVFVVACSYDRRWLPDGIDATRRLRAHGYPVTYREIPQGHSFAAWREELGAALRAFAPRSR